MLEKFTSFLQEINQVLTFIPYDEDIKKEGIIVAKTKEVYQLSQSKKMMVFVLSMSLYGLATLFSELIPSINLGVIEFSVEYLEKLSLVKLCWVSSVVLERLRSSFYFH